MESFYNKIAFPQSAVQLRGIDWNGPEDLLKEADEPFLKKEFLTEKRGECATFLVTVRYRAERHLAGKLSVGGGKPAREFKSALETDDDDRQSAERTHIRQKPFEKKLVSKK